MIIETTITPAGSSQPSSTIYEFVEDDDIETALAWENREDFFTLGKIKGVAGAVADAAAGALGSPLAGAVAALRFARTATVIGALEALKSQLSSDDAQKVVQYILDKKQMKAVKAAVGMTPASSGATAWNVVRHLRLGAGIEREAVAKEIYQRMKRVDKDYCSIVYALFSNKDDPGLWLLRLAYSTDEQLAVKVLMGKIASR